MPHCTGSDKEGYCTRRMAWLSAATSQDTHQTSWNEQVPCLIQAAGLVAGQLEETRPYPTYGKTTVHSIQPTHRTSVEPTSTSKSWNMRRTAAWGATSREPGHGECAGSKPTQCCGPRHGVHGAHAPEISPVGRILGLARRRSTDCAAAEAT